MVNRDLLYDVKKITRRVKYKIKSYYRYKILYSIYMLPVMLVYCFVFTFKLIFSSRSNFHHFLKSVIEILSIL